MKTVIVMAVSRDRLPILPRSVQSMLRILTNYASWSRRILPWSQRRRTAQSRLDWRGRPGDGEMIAGRMEGAQAVAVGRIAQRYTEHGLELLVARPNAPIVEAQRHGRDQFAGLRIGDLGRRIDADEMCRKRDLFARRCRFVVHDVEYAVGASCEGRIDRLRDVVDVDAVRDVAGLGDAVHRAAQEPRHCVLCRAVVAPAEPDPQGAVGPRCWGLCDRVGGGEGQNLPGAVLRLG